MLGLRFLPLSRTRSRSCTSFLYRFLASLSLFSSLFFFFPSFSFFLSLSFSLSLRLPLSLSLCVRFFSLCHFLCSLFYPLFYSLVLFFARFFSLSFFSISVSPLGFRVFSLVKKVDQYREAYNFD